MPNNWMRSLREIFDDQKQYKIPFYQRNFAWEEDQIHPLLTDIYEAYKNRGNQPYYIGTLVTIEHREEHEVIDGQQRLTVLSLLLRYLNKADKLKLSYDARPKVLEFLTAYYTEKKVLDEPREFEKAVTAIETWKYDNTITISALEDDVFKKYLLEKVHIVHHKMPQDTDVESYFEIMNNRGEQLQNHEILKAKLLNILPENYRENAALIWDACSQMDKIIQKSFEKEIRTKLFTDTCDQLCTYEQFHEFLASGRDGFHKGNSIEDIIKTSKEQGFSGQPTANHEQENDNTSRAIIDFPNFLMHVFKLYNEDTIPLNDNNLLDQFVWECILKKDLSEDDKQQSAIRLFYKIFHCRVFFDRYIVHTTGEDDEFAWSLKKPKVYGGKIYFINTFSQKDNEDEETYEQKSGQNRTIKALSMLQVSYRSRLYKNWLFKIFRQYCPNTWRDIQYSDYLQFLHGIMKDGYEAIKDNNNNDDYLSQGTNTPRFLFFFIDYLYYVANMDSPKYKNMGLTELDHVGDFEFRYHNSIEHHLSQKLNLERKNIKPTEKIHSIGNLLLVSSSENSRLSDRAVGEKIERRENTKSTYPPKRNIMYKLSHKINEKAWEEADIVEHHDQVETLLELYSEILNII